MRLDPANQLLEPGDLSLESGTVRLDDGQPHVASRTTMAGCKGWHPKDHLWCERVGERATGRYVGGTHHVHEYIGGELMKLKIHFREPSDYLDVSRFAEASVSTAVCVRVGSLEAPVFAGHLIHLVRDTARARRRNQRVSAGYVR